MSNKGRNFKLVIFDCDGVLVDSEPLAAEAYHNVYAAQGMPIPDGTVAQCVGMKQADIIKKIADLTGHMLPAEGEARLWPETRTLFTRHLQPTREITGFLEQLSLPRCVASSSSLERIHHSLAVTRLNPFFGKDIFSSSMVKHGKPAPDLFLHAARTMGIEPEDCVVIEDSHFGVEGAVAAGMTAVGYIGGGHTHDRHSEQLQGKGASVIFDNWRGICEYITA
ncbi:MAG: HAD family hydrolase [Phyllobacterium sp.]